MNPPNRTIRLVLADDDALIRAGLRTILSSDPALQVVGEAENGLRAIQLAEQLTPDVVLLDIRMPQLDGLSALEQLISRDPDSRVLILTTFGEEEYIDRAMSSGASGFLLKSSPPGELIAAVHAVAQGAAALSPRIARRVVDRLRGLDLDTGHRANQRLESLTPREIDVLALVGAGFSNTDIAHRLVLTPATVKGHMTSILLKLQVSNRVQAALLAYQAGIVTEQAADP